MATLTGIKLMQGGQSGAVVCTADEGTSAMNNALIKLTDGVKWSVKDPLTLLQKKVAINAKIERLGQPTRSFAKVMTIESIKAGGNTVTLK